MISSGLLRFEYVRVPLGYISRKHARIPQRGILARLPAALVPLKAGHHARAASRRFSQNIALDPHLIPQYPLGHLRSAKLFHCLFLVKN